jgi:hypothetical protein
MNGESANVMEKRIDLVLTLGRRWRCRHNDFGQIVGVLERESEREREERERERRERERERVCVWGGGGGRRGGGVQ